MNRCEIHGLPLDMGEWCPECEYERQTHAERLVATRVAASRDTALVLFAVLVSLVLPALAALLVRWWQLCG